MNRKMQFAERIREALARSLTSLDNPGFCKACGLEQEGVEPDARNLTCEACGEPEVFGAQELMLEGYGS